MKTIPAERGKPLCIGHQGENNARQVVFDLSHWRAVYGSGTVQLIVQRGGESTPYPAALAVDGNRAVWAITAADTAIPGGCGRAELRYMIGDTLVKSEVWTTIVMDALGEPSEAPPEPQKAWVDQVLAAGAEAQTAAAQAQADANRAETASGSASDSANAAGIAAQRSEEAAAQVETALGQASWVGFELDDDGILCAVLSPGFTGAQFALTEDGYLEVVYG